ncbi:hypothetical protein, partial [uncultured Akkermansia sp.]|uniref:hypothetical protein n=1 Tax=uncultured Akkermansia sp. TaxID=512294 RepID=UPI0026087CA7
ATRLEDLTWLTIYSPSEAWLFPWKDYGKRPVNKNQAVSEANQLPSTMIPSIFLRNVISGTGKEA